LVIPRIHVPELWSIDPALGAVLMEAVLKVGRAINSTLRPEGMNLISSSGEAAEQSVFHLHLHVVPRWQDDEIGKIWPRKKALEASGKENLADAVRRACHD
jgi:histidine triad (HIT) family protein